MKVVSVNDFLHTHFRVSKLFSVFLRTDSGYYMVKQSFFNKRNTRRRLPFLCLFFLFLSGLAFSETQLAQIPSAPMLPLNDSIQTPQNLASPELVLPDDSLSDNASAKDTLAKDSTNAKKKGESITMVVDYAAMDSLVILDNGIARMYRTAAVKYGDMNLDAGFIQMDRDSNIVFATGIRDSANKLIEEPVFKDKGGEYQSRELKYNFATRKGLIKHVVTQQGEGYVVSGTTKKVGEDILCMVDGKYTTCENHDHPHFYLALSKAKMKQNGWIVSGPAHLVMEDVDLPLFIPFGYFPFKGDYHSGFLMPTYGDELQRGFYLSEMGYYFAFGEHMDLALRTDIYSKGSWGVKLNSTYKKRYKFTGSIQASYIETVTSEKNLPDYAVAKDIRVNWRHSQDQKANPYQSFSAGVNFSTSGYTRNNLQSIYNNTAFSENQKSTSVSFTQRFPESPFTFSMSMNINQITRDTTLSVSLPNLNVSMSSIYPLKRKNPVGAERWYERLRMSYSARTANSIQNVKEYDFFKKSLVKDWKNGIIHNIPVSMDFTVLNYINISGNFNYTERWYTNSINKLYDPSLQKIVTDTTWGFNRVWDYSTSLTASTRLYGLFQLNPKVFGNWSQIRHMVSPSISFNYRPDFGAKSYGYWDTYTYLDNFGNTKSTTYSRFANSLYGVPGTGKSGSIGFSLSNNLEMKVRQETDTATNYKKVSLIDAFNIGGAYNLAADSMNLSNISVSLRMKFGSLYTLNLSTSLQPYTYILDRSGNPVRVNKTQFEKYGIPGRMTGVGTSFQYSIGNDTFKKLAKKFGKKSESTTEAKSASTESNTASIDDTGNKPSTSGLSEAKKKPLDAESALYMPSTIPWSISMSYSMRYQQAKFNKTRLEYDYDVSQNLSLSGNISLTQKWRISASSSFNFETKKLDHLMCSFSRDLHCWTMSGSFIPIGPYKSYNLTIAVKSSLLSDLKYEQRQNPRDNYIW